jgi:hypothetical protein
MITTIATATTTIASGIPTEIPSIMCFLRSARSPDAIGRKSPSDQVTPDIPTWRVSEGPSSSAQRKILET